ETLTAPARTADEGLPTERSDNPPVPPPAEIDTLCRELIEDVRANPANDGGAVAVLAQAIEDLRRDWRSLWLVHGPAESGWPDYRRLLHDLEAAAGGLPQLVVERQGLAG